ncbi:MAG: 3alpha(or 20beta)-hydroxysteroid dehydrogenase [Acidimicrobiales bacterium]|jgi:3alpha(or 20beta)-hydroxysteroid dehydrogenase
MGRLDGKVAIITGAARGQGAAEAQMFADEGATVVLTDVLSTEGEATAAAVGGTFHHHDVSNEDAWERVVAATLASHGRVDVLVNNAGIFHRAKLVDHTLDDFKRLLDINTVGVFLGMRSVAPAMIEQGSGSIVNISSIAGLVGAPNSIGYGASKFAVTGMTKTAAFELARHGIRVNSIHPGMIDTEMIHEVASHDDGRLEKMAASTPFRRAADPKEIANLALFLASDESSFSSGSEFVADGGVTAT